MTIKYNTIKTAYAFRAFVQANIYNTMLQEEDGAESAEALIQLVNTDYDHSLFCDTFVGHEVEPYFVESLLRILGSVACQAPRHLSKRVFSLEFIMLANNFVLDSLPCEKSFAKMFLLQDEKTQNKLMELFTSTMAHISQVPFKNTADRKFMDYIMETLHSMLKKTI